MNAPSAPARVALACLALTMFAGCARSPGETPLARQTPPAEQLVADPVPVPQPRVGDNAFAHSARVTSALNVCNGRLTASRARVADLRRALAGQGR
jgi:hypothetical protein